MIDFLGWLATGLVAMSFLFKKIIRIRITNLIGCLTWVVYGLLIKSYPIITTNVIISVIQVYWLIKLKREQK